MPRASVATMRKAAKRYANGESVEQLSERYGFKVRTIEGWLKKANVTFTPGEPETPQMPQAQPVQPVLTEESERDEVAKRYWAKIPFTYNGVDLERGEVFTFSGQPMDAKLRGLGYVAEVIPGEPTFTEDQSGKVFVNQSLAYHYQRLRAKRAEATGNPALEDSVADAEYRTYSAQVQVGHDVPGVS